MSEKIVQRLNIDDVFSKLIPPLSDDEYKQLETNIQRDGCREPLCVWKGTIIDGHNRYKICQKHQIPFAITSMHFSRRDEVIAWICDNQLGRRNISEEMRRYLIGKRYEAEKTIGARNAIGRNQYSEKEDCTIIWSNPPKVKNVYRTAAKLGEEYHLSHGTVLKYGAYARAVDTLTKSAPELVPQILSGQVKMSQENVIEMAELPSKEVKALSSKIGQCTSDSYIKYSDIRETLPIKHKRERFPTHKVPSVSIKDMPTHDPDAEIASLSYTIPSWISAVDRARKTAVIPETSINARAQLMNELTRLIDMADSMLKALKEES